MLVAMQLADWSFAAMAATKAFPTQMVPLKKDFESLLLFALFIELEQKIIILTARRPGHQHISNGIVCVSPSKLAPTQYRLLGNRLWSRSGD